MYKGFDVLWKKKAVADKSYGTVQWELGQNKEGGNKAISTKIRDNAENTSLNEEMLTKRKDKRHGEVWLSAGRWV